MKTNRPSATAQMVAGSLLCLEGKASRETLLPDDPHQWRSWVLAGSVTARALKATARFGLTRALWQWLECQTLPGVMAHYARRKARIEWHCREALAQGMQRVVVLGAGLDTLALRLAGAYPHVDWVELDHPATQALKQRGLARSGQPLPDNLRWQSVDFVSPQALGHLMQAWPERPTLFIAEGLLMYLSEQQVSAILNEVWCHSRNSCNDPDSIPIDESQLLQTHMPHRLIATYMQHGPGGRAGFSPQSLWIDRWLRWRGEPFLWAAHPDDMARWARSNKLVLLSHERAPFVSRQDAGLQGENLIVASVT